MLSIISLVTLLFGNLMTETHEVCHIVQQPVGTGM